jgi:hypothetical protein
MITVAVWSTRVVAEVVGATSGPGRRRWQFVSGRDLRWVTARTAGMRSTAARSHGPGVPSRGRILDPRNRVGEGAVQARALGHPGCVDVDITQAQCRVVPSAVDPPIGMMIRSARARWSTLPSDRP